MARSGLQLPVAAGVDDKVGDTVVKVKHQVGCCCSWDMCESTVPKTIGEKGLP